MQWTTCPLNNMSLRMREEQDVEERYLSLLCRGADKKESIHEQTHTQSHTYTYEHTRIWTDTNKHTHSQSPHRHGRTNTHTHTRTDTHVTRDKLPHAHKEFRPGPGPPVMVSVRTAIFVSAVRNATLAAGLRLDCG